MMDQTGTFRFEYEDVMRALGYFIDQNSLREICIVELKEGILLRGTSHTANRSGFLSMSESYLFTNEDLERIIEEAYERRGIPRRETSSDAANTVTLQPLPAQAPGQGQPPTAPMPPR
jgi:hypothetical protein